MFIFSHNHYRRPEGKGEQRPERNRGVGGQEESQRWPLNEETASKRVLSRRNAEDMVEQKLILRGKKLEWEENQGQGV